MSMDTVIEVANVTKTFTTRHFFARDEQGNGRRLYSRKTVEAVRQVDFSIKRGEIFGLLGPNGAGKTTTVKMISGLVRPTAGKVYVDGICVELERLKVLRRLGVVLEGTRTSIWPLTPLENLVYFGNLKDVKGRVLKQRARELLEFIGLKDKMDVQVRRLSRGQKQRLAICIALIADPPVILLDEPTTGLDVQSARSIKDKVIEMTREHGKSVLVTTHDMHVAQELCDRIGIINNGRLVTCKPTQQLIGLFSDQTYDLITDKIPDTGLLGRIDGITRVDVSTTSGGPHLSIGFTPDEDVRSAALYGLIEQLKAQQIVIRSLSQRQQTLENVFLQITSQGAETTPRVGSVE